MNIFTVDLEDWYHSNYHNSPIIHQETRLVKPTLKLLKLLQKTKSKATFFVLGIVAENHPDLIKEIKKQGHEIACHSYNHQLVYSMTPKEFEIDLVKATKIIHKIIGTNPIGYRAPSWSVSQKTTPWFWKTLKKHGYQYSSSLFPFRTFLYGDSSVNPLPHSINGLLEIPPTIATIFKQRIPFSGGFYLRALPLPIIKYLSNLNSQKKILNMYYIHPREIDSTQPKLNLSTKDSFIHYLNISGTYAKLEEILKKPTQSLQTAIKNKSIQIQYKI